MHNQAGGAVEPRSPPTALYEDKMKQKYLFDDPHWEIESVRDLQPFFGALIHLVPEGAILCLGDGDPDETILSFFHQQASSEPERIPLIEFMKGQYLPINKENIKELEDLAASYAAPEIATHIAVSDQNRQILEWFDAPFDPITISLEVPEDNVKKFCNELGVKYKKVKAEQ